MSLYRIDETLSKLAGGLPPVARRKVMRKIARYLRTQFRRNITHQRDANGRAWKKRKNPKNRRKMLLGYRKKITDKSDKDMASVGMFGGVSETTLVHHQGNFQEGIKYPERPLIGWTKTNHKVIKIMILEAIQAQAENLS